MAINKSAFFKELSLKDSNKKVQQILKERIKLNAKKHIRPGHIVFTSYNAKDKTRTYDKTPLILVLKRGTKYTLGLNFHWLPVNLRIKLIKRIVRANKDNIIKGKPLEFTYSDFKPLMRSMNYAPCIRLYINARLGRIGVQIKPERLGEIARIKGESFTNGKYSSNELYKRALSAGRRRNKKRRNI